MASQTVPDQKTKRADELKPGDWTVGLGADGRGFDGFGSAEVLFVRPFTDDVGRPRVLIVLGESGFAGPQPVRIDAASNVRLMTEAEIAEQRADDSRWQVANDLRRLADLIVNHKLPLPRMSVSVSCNFNSVDEVRRVAEPLGLDLRPWNLGKGAATSWPRGHESYDSGVHAEWHCYSGSLEEPKPEPVAEHYFVNGSIGGPGEFSAECACGTTFSGFDSLAEANAQLDLHIADPSGLTFSREDDDPQVIRPHSPRPPAHIGDVESHISADGRREDDETPQPTATRPLVSDETIAEAAAMEERDRLAGGSPWEVPDHPDNSLPGGWHRGQIR